MKIDFSQYSGVAFGFRGTLASKNSRGSFEGYQGVFDVVYAAAAACEVGNVIIVGDDSRYSEIRDFVGVNAMEGVIRSRQIVSEETLEDQCGLPKPAPDPYIIAESLMVPGDMLVVEGTLDGVESAKRAGATVLALGTRVTKQAFYDAEFKPDMFAEGFYDIEVKK